MTITTDAEAMSELIRVAAKISDGHVTILKFTTNWRVAFFTPEDRIDIDHMPGGKTFVEAAAAAISREASTPPSAEDRDAWWRKVTGEEPS